MPFESIAAVLREQGEKYVDVEAAFLLKPGCLMFSMAAAKSEDSRYPVTDVEECLRTVKQLGQQEFHAALVARLKKLPNIFDLNVEGDRPHGLMMGAGIPGGSLVLGPRFTLRVDLPERLQKFRDWPTLGGTPVEEFDVISGGSIFGAYIEISDFPAFNSIGQEYRELVESTDISEVSFKYVAIGPTPIHPDIYVIVRKKALEREVVGLRVYGVANDVFVVVDHEFVNPQRAVEMVFRRIEGSLSMFYSVLGERHLLLHYEVELANLFSDVSEAAGLLADTSWWNLYGALALSRRGKAALSRIHVRSVDFGYRAMSFRKNRDDVLDMVGKHEILSDLIPYLQRITESDIAMPDSYGPAVAHFAEQLRGFGTVWSLIVASVLGGAVGAILTELLSRLLSK